MYVRIDDVTVGADRVDELRDVLSNNAPVMIGQEGCEGLLVRADRADGKLRHREHVEFATVAGTQRAGDRPPSEPRPSRRSTRELVGIVIAERYCASSRSADARRRPGAGRTDCGTCWQGDEPWSTSTTPRSSRA